MNGAHLSDFRIENLLPPSGILAGNDGEIAVNSVWDEPIFAVYEMGGNLRYGIGKFVIGGKPTIPVRTNFNHLSQTPDGRILYSPSKRYEVFQLDRDGTILYTYVAEPDGYYPFPDMPRPRTGPMNVTPLFRPLYVSGHVVVQRSGKTAGGVSGLDRVNLLVESSPPVFRNCFRMLLEKQSVC